MTTTADRDRPARPGTSFDMKITEGVERWDRIVETVREHSAAWQEEATDHA